MNHLEEDRKFKQALEKIEPRLQGIANHGKVEFHCEDCEKRFTTALVIVREVLKSE